MSIPSRYKLPAIAFPAVLLAGCAGAPPPAPPPVTLPIAGLERVMGKDRQTLVALFGEPDLDIHEGNARKLQFTSPVCVFDAYLYPTAKTAVPTVTYVEARTPKGDDFDRASCIAVLTRQPEARQSIPPEPARRPRR